MKVRMHADSAAAIGICRRSGIGRVRHLAVGQLWVQEGLRRGDFTLFKVQGDQNPADIFTKCVSRELLDRHLSRLSVQRVDGRAATAPMAQLGGGGVHPSVAQLAFTTPPTTVQTMSAQTGIPGAVVSQFKVQTNRASTRWPCHSGKTLAKAKTPQRSTAKISWLHQSMPGYYRSAPVMFGPLTTDTLDHELRTNNLQRSHDQSRSSGW